MHYDAVGPDAYFMVGKSPSPDPKGQVVPYPPIMQQQMPSRSHFYQLTGQRSRSYHMGKPNDVSRHFGGQESGRNKNHLPPLSKMNEDDVLLTLPGTIVASEVRWLAIWCMRFAVKFGEIMIPMNLTIPRPLVCHVYELTNCLHQNNCPFSEHRHLSPKQ